MCVGGSWVPHTSTDIHTHFDADVLKCEDEINSEIGGPRSQNAAGESSE